MGRLSEATTTKTWGTGKVSKPKKASSGVSKAIGKGSVTGSPTKSIGGSTVIEIRDGVKKVIKPKQPVPEGTAYQVYDSKTGNIRNLTESGYQIYVREQEIQAERQKKQALQEQQRQAEIKQKQQKQQRLEELNKYKSTQLQISRSRFEEKKYFKKKEETFTTAQIMQLQKEGKFDVLKEKGLGIYRDVPPPRDTVFTTSTLEPSTKEKATHVFTKDMNIPKPDVKEVVTTKRVATGEVKPAQSFLEQGREIVSKEKSFGDKVSKAGSLIVERASGKAKEYRVTGVSTSDIWKPIGWEGLAFMFAVPTTYAYMITHPVKTVKGLGHFGVDLVTHPVKTTKEMLDYGVDSPGKFIGELYATKKFFDTGAYVLPRVTKTKTGDIPLKEGKTTPIKDAIADKPPNIYSIESPKIFESIGYKGSFDFVVPEPLRVAGESIIRFNKEYITEPIVEVSKGLKEQTIYTSEIFTSSLKEAGQLTSEGIKLTAEPYVSTLIEIGKGLKEQAQYTGLDLKENIGAGSKVILESGKDAGKLTLEAVKSFEEISTLKETGKGLKEQAQYTTYELYKPVKDSYQEARMVTKEGIKLTAEPYVSTLKETGKGLKEQAEYTFKLDQIKPLSFQQGEILTDIRDYTFSRKSVGWEYIIEPLKEIGKGLKEQAQYTGLDLKENIGAGSKVILESGKDAGKLTLEAGKSFGKEHLGVITYALKETLRPPEFNFKSNLPKLNIEAMDLSRGYIPRTTAEGKMFKESLDIYSPEQIININKYFEQKDIPAIPVSGETLSLYLEIKESTLRQKSAFIDKELPSGVEAFKLGEKGSEKIVFDFTKEYQGYPYGSAPASAQMPKGEQLKRIKAEYDLDLTTKSPADIDVMFPKETDLSLRPAVESNLLKPLKEKKNPFKLADESLLIETTKKDLPSHAVDIHTQTTVAQDVISPAFAKESAYGFDLNQPLMKFKAEGKSYDFQPLSEQATRKGTSIMTIREIEIVPEGFKGKTQGLTQKQIKEGLEFHHTDYVKNEGKILTKQEHILIHDLISGKKKVTPELRNFYDENIIITPKEKVVTFAPELHRMKDIGGYFATEGTLQVSKTVPDYKMLKKLEQLKEKYPKKFTEQEINIRDTEIQSPAKFRNKKSPPILSPSPIRYEKLSPSPYSSSPSKIKAYSLSPYSSPSLSPSSSPSPYSLPSPSLSPSTSASPYSSPSLSPSSSPSPYSLPSPSTSASPSASPSPSSSPSPYSSSSASPSPSSSPSPYSSSSGSPSPSSSFTTTPPPPSLITSPSKRGKRKQQTQYISEVRERGKWKQHSQFPSSLAKTTREVRDYVDETPRASFRLKPTTETNENYVKKASKYLPEKKWRKAKRDKSIFVEKRKYRIDSPGEKGGITYKGLMKIGNIRRMKWK